MSAGDVSLVVGVDGLIGRALVEHLVAAGETVLATTRRSDCLSGKRAFLDLSAEMSDWRPPRGVSAAHLCAAVSSLERCRKEPVESARVNVLNTVALAKTLVSKGAFVVFPSTNLVFDGSRPLRRAEDLPCPRTEYGRQKAETERQLLALGDHASVVRFSKVLGPRAPLFEGWVNSLQNHETIHPFSDMVMTPVPVAFAVRVLHRVADLHLSGIVQVSGERDVTYEEAARHIASHLGVSQDLVQPVRSLEAGLQLESVPLHTTLDTTRLREELGLSPPEVWSTINAVMGW